MSGGPALVEGWGQPHPPQSAPPGLLNSGPGTEHMLGVCFWFLKPKGKEKGKQVLEKCHLMHVKRTFNRQNKQQYSKYFSSNRASPTLEPGLPFESSIMESTRLL